MTAVAVSVRCRYCGQAIRYVASRFVWRHVTPGADHGPIPQ